MQFPVVEFYVAVAGQHEVTPATLLTVPVKIENPEGQSQLNPIMLVKVGTKPELH